MSRYLLDANVSPNTAQFLRDTFGVDAIHQRDVLAGSPRDEEIVARAKLDGHFIITFDLGFGERYYRQERGQVGVIVLRLRNQRRPSVEQALSRFFHREARTLNLDTSLVVIEETTVRTIGPE